MNGPGRSVRLAHARDLTADLAVLVSGGEDVHVGPAAEQRVALRCGQGQRSVRRRGRAEAAERLELHPVHATDALVQADVGRAAAEMRERQRPSERPAGELRGEVTRSKARCAFRADDFLSGPKCGIEPRRLDDNSTRDSQGRRSRTRRAVEFVAITFTIAILMSALPMPKPDRLRLRCSQALPLPLQRVHW